MNTFPRLLLIALLIVTELIASAMNVNPGDSPPQLKLEKVIQAPDGTDCSWTNLHGKVVVLEFWATWCGPCVKAIPHLNELAEEFKKEPVQFIAVTSENEQIVKNFLDRRPIKAWVGLDEFHETSGTYGVTGIPVTVVVNQQGIVADVTHPIFLTSERLREILAGKIMPKPEARTEQKSEAEVVKADSAPALFEVSIRPAKPRERGRAIGMWSSGRDPVDITGSIASVESAVHTVYQLGPARVINRTAWPKGDFDFCLRLPGASQAEAENLFGHALRSAFGLEAVRHTEEADVYVLGATTNHQARGLKPVVSAGGGSSGASGYDSSGAPVSSVAGFLEGLLMRPVLDETGLKGYFEIHLTGRAMAAFQLSRSVAAALESDANQAPANMDENDRKIFQAIRGTGSEEEFKTLPEKTQRMCKIMREELSKPEEERFLPEPEAVIKAVHDKLGLDLRSAKRQVEVLTVTKAPE
jgi:uncharacterized protein (TIGR03435 family)